ncbi:MAG TPA: rod shape-determining protein MreC [Candidatus Sulfotelmatobacter sp.]|nr:rod shape-determining protein MreC [Candidatus Sulfotelmatobacter sp.]
MQKRAGFTAYFLIFLILSISIFFFSKSPLFSPVTSVLSSIFSPFESLAYGIFSKMENFAYSPKFKALQDENYSLTKKIVDQNKLVLDNKALRDQFQTQNPKSTNLISANVIGAPSFIPGVSLPENFVLDRGEADGIQEGDAVVYRDNLVGKISRVEKNVSSVLIITNSSSSFTAKTLSTQALGVVKGQGGGELILDNVLLSDALKKGDIVLTKGDINEKNQGLIPDLIVGKIESISKNPSDLFQKAEVKSNLDFTKLDKVFVIPN